MAILYSSVDARRSAATQNAFYGFGMVVSIIALALTGLIRTPQVAFAASLAPLVPLTLYAVRPLATRFERGVSVGQGRLFVVAGPFFVRVLNVQYTDARGLDRSTSVTKRVPM